MIDNPLLDKDYCYHGIGGDVFRLPSILKSGILSQDSLRGQAPTNFIGGFNDTNKVSVIISPQFCASPNKLGGCYSDGITFVCKTPYYRNSSAVKSGILFEAHTNDIALENIKGIILPDKLFTTPIKEYNNFMCADAKLPEICSSFKGYMEKECEYQASDYDNQLRLIRASKDIFNKDRFKNDLGKIVFSDLQKAIDKKLGKKDATFADLVKYYIKDTNLKLYNREELQKDVQQPQNNYITNNPNRYKIPDY